LYVVHFDQEIKESFLTKTFQYVGEISQTHIGHFKPKASKKKQKRTLYFAIIVFKRAECLEKLLSQDGARYLQGKVNKVAAKSIRFSENPFLRDAKVDHIDSEQEEESPEERQKREERELMEADGFTMVAQDSLNPTRMKTRDGETTILGITQVEAQRIFQQQQDRKSASDVKHDY